MRALWVGYLIGGYAAPAAYWLVDAVGFFRGPEWVEWRAWRTAARLGKETLTG